METRSTELTTVIESAAIVATLGLKLPVQSEADLSDAITFLGRVKTALDQVTAQRTSLVKPLNDHVKAINAMFKPISDRLEEKVNDWKRAETARIAEQLAREVREAEAKKQEVADLLGVPIDEVHVLSIPAPEAPIKRVFAPDGNAQFSKHWTHEIVDELFIPRQWLMVDEKKLRAAVDHEGGVRNIPGVRIFQEDRLAVSGHPAASIPAAQP